MPATWQPRPDAENLHIMSLRHSYGKENRREHSRRFARLDFCKSCLQLMTLRNTAVYRYYGIFQTVYYRRAFRNTAHPYNYVTVEQNRWYRPTLRFGHRYHWLIGCLWVWSFTILGCGGDSFWDYLVFFVFLANRYLCHHIICSCILV